MRGMCPVHSKPYAEDPAGKSSQVFVFVESEKAHICTRCLEDGLFGEHAYEEARLSAPDFFRPKFLEASDAS